MHWFISFVILNQLNDNILQRIDNPKQHKPKESDIYSSGQFYKLCDVLYVKVLPWRLHITDKFMVFSKEAYKWLEDFKLFGNGNTASFEPNGVAYYFYLKRRGSDIKDMEDIFAERIFKAEQQPTPSFKTTTPVFDTPKETSFPTFDSTKPLPEVEFKDVKSVFD
jgi:hypothetical protein